MLYGTNTWHYGKEVREPIPNHCPIPMQGLNYMELTMLTKMRCSVTRHEVVLVLLLVWSLPHFVFCVDFVASNNILSSLVQQNACQLPTAISRKPFQTDVKLFFLDKMEFLVSGTDHERVDRQTTGAKKLGVLNRERDLMIGALAAYD